jgi:phenylacetic acid degradation operon negative regulatory protein
MLHLSITMSNTRNAAETTSTMSTPLTTRSIVLSLLLGSHPPVMPVSALIDFCGLFDVAPGTVRTALSRMVDRGELTTDDGRYALSGRLLTRQHEQDTGRRRVPAGWDGAWYVVIVTAERRTTTERREFRARAIGSRLGELRPDIWMRPANIEIPDDLPDSFVTRGPLVGADDEAITRQLWDLRRIDGESGQRRDDLDRAARRLERDGPDGLAPAFDALALALRQIRTEPQLPAPLHPTAAGDELRARYDDVERRFRGELQSFLHR